MLTIRIGRRTALMLILGVFLAIPLGAWASHSFTDVPNTNTFHSDIEWLKDAGVTKGCNPPANTEYCPDDAVTRGAMAAFMKRLAENQVVDAATVQGLGPADLKGEKGDPGPQGDPATESAVRSLSEWSEEFTLPPNASTNIGGFPTDPPGEGEGFVLCLANFTLSVDHVNGTADTFSIAINPGDPSSKAVAVTIDGAAPTGTYEYPVSLQHVTTPALTASCTVNVQAGANGANARALNSWVIALWVPAQLPVV